MHCTAAQKKQRLKTSATILVIEDESFVRDVTCEILRYAGYRVLQAECAAVARRIFLRHRKQIQLLLCDAVLADSSGVVLAKDLRRRSPGLKVILASGYPRGPLQDVDQTTGNVFLAKPYGAASLVSKVQVVLREEVLPEQAAQMWAR